MECVTKKIAEYDSLEGKPLHTGDVITVKWLDGTTSTESVYIESLQNDSIKRANIIVTYNKLLVRIYLSQNKTLLCERGW